MSLRLLCALAVACCAWPAMAAEPEAVLERRLDRWQPFIADAADRFDVPEAWIRAVMGAESAGLTTLDGRPITSRAGAMGLMQVMPETYEDMRRRHRLGADPHAPRDNILAGAAYLRAMRERFRFPGLFAAYNAGPTRYEAYLAGKQPLPRETLAFLATLASAGITGALGVQTRLFFPLRTPALGDSEPLALSQPNALFVPLRTSSGERR